MIVIQKMMTIIRTRNIRPQEQSGRVRADYALVSTFYTALTHRAVHGCALSEPQKADKHEF